jgi:hypothetical protein
MKALQFTKFLDTNVRARRSFSALVRFGDRAGGTGEGPAWVLRTACAGDSPRVAGAGRHQACHARGSRGGLGGGRCARQGSRLRKCVACGARFACHQADDR